MLTEFIGWVLRTVTTAAEAEMNDDTALREQLLEAEMRREMGEISDDEFKEIEGDLLARIREIRERREGGAGPLSMGSAPIETSPDTTFQVEASVTGEFHEPAEAPHTTVIELAPGFEERISVEDIAPAGTPRTVRTIRTPASAEAPAGSRRRSPGVPASEGGSSKLRKP
jgi:gas vesicle protein GvpG